MKGNLYLDRSLFQCQCFQIRCSQHFFATLVPCYGEFIVIYLPYIQLYYKGISVILESCLLACTIPHIENFIPGGIKLRTSDASLTICDSYIGQSDLLFGEYLRFIYLSHRYHVTPICTSIAATLEIILQKLQRLHCVRTLHIFDIESNKTPYNIQYTLGKCIADWTRT